MPPKLNKNVLILGGSGLLGSHCVQYFSKNYNVYWTYNTLKNIVPNGIKFSFFENLESLSKIFNFTKPDIIINAIGLVSVDFCEINKKHAYDLNQNFVEIIVSTLEKLKMTQTYLVHISSGGVYGKRIHGKDTPWKETDNLNPLSVYAKSKIGGEKNALNYIGPKLIIRSDFYGINDLQRKHSLLSWIIYNAKNQIPMEGWENIFFSPISANKLSRTIDTLIQNKLTGIFNISSTNYCNKFEFVDVTCDTIKIKPMLKTNEVVSKIRPRYSVLSCQKIKSKISFECDWKEELKSYIKKFNS